MWLATCQLCSPQRGFESRGTEGTIVPSKRPCQGLSVAIDVPGLDGVTLSSVCLGASLCFSTLPQAWPHPTITIPGALLVALNATTLPCSDTST